MGIKIYVAFNRMDLIKNISSPANGGERFQVMLILSLLEIGYNVWVSLPDKISPESKLISKEYTNKKGCINFITDKEISKLANNFFDLAFSLDYIPHDMSSDDMTRKSKSLIGCVWSVPENEIWDFGEKLKTILYFDHFSIFDNEGFFLKDGKTSKFKTTSKYELNHCLWVPPLKDFLNENKWNPKYKRIVIDDFYRNDDWDGKKHLVKCIQDFTREISLNFDDVFCDFIARDSFLSAIETKKGLRVKNADFDWGDENIDNHRILCWQDRDVLLKHISESFLYISTFSYTDKTQYRKGVVEPFLMGVPSFLYLNQLIPYSFNYRWGEYVHPNTVHDDTRHFIEDGGGGGIKRFCDKLFFLTKSLIDNPFKTSDSFGFDKLSLGFQDFFKTDSSYKSLRKIVECSL